MGFNGTVVESPNATYSSGILEEGDNITFTFPNVGVFPMQCVLHEPMMGSVTVVANQSAQQLSSSSQVTAQGIQQFNQAVASIPALELQILANSTTGMVDVGGRQAFRVMVGGGNGSIQYVRFLPANITVSEGDTIAFVYPGNGSIAHTATFNGTDGEFNDDPQTVSTPNGPLLGPNINFLLGQPTQDNNVTYNGTGIAGSGYFGFATQGPWFITFTKAGVYPYICAIHDELGMVGVVTVNAKA